MKKLFYIAYLIICFSCKNSIEDEPRNLFPNPHYNFVAVERSSFNTIEQYYVPVYSSIYGASGKNEYLLSATLSIRNIGYTDSIYISKINYYGSDGKLIKKYFDSTVLLMPMSSMEVVVTSAEKEGGAGANFVVECMGNNLLNEPLIQTVMTMSNMRFVFSADAVKIKRTGE